MLEDECTINNWKSATYRQKKDGKKPYRVSRNGSIFYLKSAKIFNSVLLIVELEAYETAYSVQKKPIEFEEIQIKYSLYFFL